MRTSDRVHRLVGRPSPAMVVALLALFVALGGAGYAAVKINGKQLRNASVAGKKLKRDTLTGKQVKEAALGIVPAADRANTAGSADTASSVQGSRLRSFHYHSDGVSPQSTVFELDGFRLSAECTSGSGIIAWVRSTAGDAHLSAAAVSDFNGDGSDGVAQEVDRDLTNGVDVALMNPLSGDGAVGTIVYARSNRTVTVTYRADEGGGGTVPCDIQGTAQSSPVG